VFVGASVCVCVFVWVSVCVYVCVFVWVPVCVCLFVWLSVCLCVIHKPQRKTRRTGPVFGWWATVKKYAYKLLFVKFISQTSIQSLQACL